MPEVATLHCASCGAPTDPIQSHCSYCGNFLLHLSWWERETSKADEEGQKKPGGFRSLAGLYKACIWLSFIIMLPLYTFLFDLFSETMLVMISPSWFLLFHFGMSGLYGERAVRLIINGEQKDFGSALREAQRQSPPIVALAIGIVFMPPYALFRLQRFTSPLYLAGLTTLIWGALLYGFFVAIFPSL